MKILHTSDLQLDAPFLFLGEGGQRHREQLRKTFVAIVDMAEKNDYQLLLIAGDLFNSNHPLQSTLDTVIHLLGKLTIPVCILPGNHDPYDKTCIYRRVAFPPNVTIFHDEINLRVFLDLDLAIYGNAVTQKDQNGSPLENIRPGADVRWHVAMAHGSVRTGLGENPNLPIQPEEIVHCGMDYVALGDWHSFSDHSQGHVRAVYSGAPEPMAYDQVGAGFISSVSLDEEGVRVEKIRVGEIHAQQVSVNVFGQNEAEIQELILEHAGAEKLTDVILSGLTEPGIILDPSRLETLLSPNFYALRIRDLSHPKISDLSTNDFPQGLIRRYIDVMADRAQQTQNSHHADLVEQALQLGVALLEGKEVI